MGREKLNLQSDKKKSPKNVGPDDQPGQSSVDP